MKNSQQLRRSDSHERISIDIDFWDTAGQEVFNKMHPSYYYRAHCCILVFDVTRKITYQHLTDWYAELREHCPNIPCVLIANKIDADYNVSLHIIPAVRLWFYSKSTCLCR